MESLPNESPMKYLNECELTTQHLDKVEISSVMNGMRTRINAYAVTSLHGHSTLPLGFLFLPSLSISFA